MKDKRNTSLINTKFLHSFAFHMYCQIQKSLSLLFVESRSLIRFHIILGSISKLGNEESLALAAALSSLHFLQVSEPVFLNVKELRDRFQGIDSASLCSLSGRYDKYDKPIPWNRISGLLKRLQIRAQM